jgi:hypothetical protein
MVAVYGLAGVEFVLLVVAFSCIQTSAFYKDKVRLWHTLEKKIIRKASARIKNNPEQI